MLNGGIPRKSNLLVTGAPGTGKTIMALQFVFNGIKKYGENGLYISTEETLENVRMHAKGLKIDLKKYENSGELFLYEMDITTLKGGMSSIKGLLSLIKRKKIKRFALDSLIMFDYIYEKYARDEIEFRRHIMSFLKKIKEAGVTSFIVSERKSVDFDKPHFTEMDFIFDGFVVLSRIRKGSYFERVLTVSKMRGMDHSLDIHPIKIGGGGVKILIEQTPFSLAEGSQKGFKIG